MGAQNRSKRSKERVFGLPSVAWPERKSQARCQACVKGAGQQLSGSAGQAHGTALAQSEKARKLCGQRAASQRQPQLGRYLLPATRPRHPPVGSWLLVQVQVNTPYDKL
jgi:hypothetical protein